MSEPWRLVGCGRLGSSLFASLQSIGVACEIEPKAHYKSWPEAWQGQSILLCVPDDVLHQCARWAYQPARLPARLVFFSGATPVSIFQSLADRVAVAKLHPLCSFPNREQRPFPAQLTFAMAGNPELLSVLADWVDRWQGNQLNLPDHLAGQYHLAAVLASNFLGLMVREGAELLKDLLPDRGQALKALAPLVRQSLAAALDPELDSPYSGPAARGDTGQIARHFSALQRLDPDLAELYRLLSARILQRISASR